MKVLFLDIDGVLNSAKWAREYKAPVGESDRWSRMFDPETLDQLIRVVSATDCLIVLSSAWRMLGTRSDVRGKLLHGGMPNWIVGRIFSHTPYQPDDHRRGAEIQAWLDAWPSTSERREPVERYAIVDDGDDINASQLDHFVKTDWAVGLTAAGADKLIEILGRMN